MAWRYVRKEATPVDAQRNRTTTPLQAAAATGKLTLKSNSPVERINTDAAQRQGHRRDLHRQAQRPAP